MSATLSEGARIIIVRSVCGWELVVFVMGFNAGTLTEVTMAFAGQG